MPWQKGKVPAASSASPVTGLLSRRGRTAPHRLRKPLCVVSFTTATSGSMQLFSIVERKEKFSSTFFKRWRDSKGRRPWSFSAENEIPMRKKIRRGGTLSSAFQAAGFPRYLTSAPFKNGKINFIKTEGTPGKGVPSFFETFDNFVGGGVPDNPKWKILCL